MVNTLSFIEQTAAALKNNGDGDISLAYLTAEFAPSISAQKPDLVIIQKYHNGSRAYIIEYSLAAPPLDLTSFKEFLLEHKEFIITTSEIPCEYGFATCHEIPIEVQNQLWQSTSIKLFTEVKSPDVFAKLIGDWMNSFQPAEVQL